MENLVPILGYARKHGATDILGFNQARAGQAAYLLLAQRFTD